MELKEMIKIMEHFMNGGEVECVETGLNDWKIANDPSWNWYDYNYRIKEEPKQKVTIEKWLIKDVNSGEHFIMESSDVDLNLKALDGCKLKLLESYEVEL